LGREPCAAPGCGRKEHPSPALLNRPAIKRLRKAILEVLAERELPGGGRMSGRSENYLEVAFPAGGERLGKLCRVRVGACRNGVLDGEVTG